MNLFNTSGKDAHEQAPSKWIEAPCVAVATIVKAEFWTSPGKGTPAIMLTHMTEPVAGVDHELGKGRIAETAMWVTPKSAERTVNAIMLLANRLGFRDQLDTATSSLNDSSTGEDFAKAVVPVLQGQKGAFIFSAQEVWIKDKDTGEYGTKPWLKPQMNTLGTFVREESKINELIERFNLRGADKFISVEERPADAQTPADGDDGDW